MTVNQPSATVGPRDWRSAAAQALPLPGLRRFLLSLLLLALFALLVWLLLLFISPLPAIKAVFLPVAEYDIPIAPVPFLPGNAVEFQRLASQPGTTVHVWDKLQTSENIGGIAAAFNGLGLNGKNTLVFYVQAHTICVDGTAYLACSDLLRGDERAALGGCYRIADLLRHVQQCKAKLKLVVFDVGYLRCDARLGLLVDEFPLVLEAELKRLADPQLWVLVSHGPLEGGHGSYAANCSAMVRFFVEGLLGDSDRAGSDDSVVDLAELCQFVQSGVETWVDQKSGHRQSQRPILLRGGQGIVPSPEPGLALARTVPVADRAAPGGKEPSPPAEPKNAPQPTPAAADAKGDEKPKATQAQKPQTNPAATPAPAPSKVEPAAAGKNADSVAARAPKAEGDSPNATPAEEPLPPRGPARVRALLERAWRLRDRMADRSAGGGWLPLDYAPHLWRQYQETLLGYELRFRYGYLLSGERLVPLEELASARSFAGLTGDERRTGAGESSLLRRITAARRHFTAEGIAAAFASHPELRVLEESIQLRDELCATAPYYVRWHGQAVWLADDTIPLYRDLGDLLGKELPQLVASIEELDETSFSGPDVRMKIADLAEKMQRLRQLREKIEHGADGLDRRADETIERFDPRRLNAHWPEELLSTPLLAGGIRFRLLDRLLHGGPSFDLPRREPERPATTASAKRWDRLAEQASLEVLLARLADPKVRLTTYPQAAPDAFAAPRPGASAQQLEQTYRQLGKELKDFYQALPAEIEVASDAADKRGLPRAGRLLRFVDARDGARVPEKADYAALLPPPLKKIVESKLELASAQKRLAVPRNGDWVDWTPTILVVPEPREKVVLTVSYPAERLEVVERETSRAVRSGDSSAIDAQAGVPTEIAYRIRAKGDFEWRQVELVVKAQADAAATECRLQVALPLADRVDLIARRLVDPTGRAVPADVLSGASGTSGAAYDRCLCDAFPNRRTEYLFSLKNAAEENKKVDVQLWAVPAEGAARERFPLGPLDPWGKSLPGFRLLAQAIGLSLPAESDPVLVPFTSARAAAAPAKKEPDQAAAAAKKEEPKLSVVAGLVCVIRETTKQDLKKPPWIKWIDFWPVSPRRYLEPKLTFQPGKIHITLKPLAADWLPIISPDDPLAVEWDRTGLPDASLPMKTSAKIAAAGEQALLFAELPRDFRGQITVRLSVDHYPRAFVYQVRCDRAREEVRPEIDLREIKFLSPQDGQAFRAPLDTLPVELAVDAPTDAFQNPDDSVEVWLNVREGAELAHDRVVLRSDRQWSVTVEEITPEGFLKTRAEAHDFQLGLNPLGLRNAEIDIRAQLRVRHNPTPPKSVRVFLDGSEPEIVRLETPREPVIRGEEALILFEAKDSGSGVKKIEVGIDLDNSDTLDEKEKLLELVAPNTEGSRTAKIPTKGLGPGHVFPLIVRATDNCGFTKSRKGYLLVAEPPPPPPKTEEPKPEVKLSGIRGRATTGTDGLGWPKLEVRIPELGRSAQLDKQSGQFSFADVPQGKYKIVAEGWYGNREVKGEAQVTVTAEPASIDVPMK